MKRVIWSDAAIADLRSLKAFLDENYEPEVTRRALEQIVPGGRFLLRFPGAGAPLGDPTLRKWRPKNGYQNPICRSVRGGIEIIRVRHSVEDWREE